ncbi:Crp/Fnr family transcriptional regulator [Aquiflexum sp.]|uniref:Crp/Fnr family transcriptional regulator n=1 Tax=Aquiflexum sp. TaxID=1872584 RepID=UPI00359453E0
MSPIKAIQQFVSLSKEEIAEIASLFEKKEIVKGGRFLEYGKICDKVGYIESGSLIFVKHDSEGNQIATDFLFDGDWVSYYNSLLLEIPSDVDIICNEDCVIHVLTKSKLELVYESFPKMERLGRMLAEHAFIDLAKRSSNLQKLSGKERYLDLMQRKSIVLEKIPQYYIASYLGIQPQSLSRIRKKILG